MIDNSINEVKNEQTEEKLDTDSCMAFNDENKEKSGQQNDDVMQSSDADMQIASLQKQSLSKNSFNQEKDSKVIANMLENEEFLENNVYTNKRICEEIIDRYIMSLKNGMPPKVLGSGGNGASKIKPPASLKEAKLLADIMFESQK